MNNKTLELIEQDIDLREFNQHLNDIEPYYILCIVIIGLTGNTMSFILFVATKLKYINSYL
jgi:hypothetical protein